MADFKKAWVITSKNEGGYINDPSDSGGETYCGISRKFFPQWQGWGYIDKYKPLKNNEIIKNDSFISNTNEGIEDLVTTFYKNQFWDKVFGDKIINQEVANELFDSSVNMGIHEAVILTQKSLDIPNTGIMDNSTLNTLNSQNPYA